MKILFILNDPPYGTERCYNALRLAHALLKNDPDAQIIVFLMADAVVGAKAGQKTPDGYYSMERMLKRVVVGKGAVLLCGTCMNARGLADDEMMAGARRSTVDELAAETTAEAPGFGDNPLYACWAFTFTTHLHRRRNGIREGEYKRRAQEPGRAQRAGRGGGGAYIDPTPACSSSISFLKLGRACTRSRPHSII